MAKLRLEIGASAAAEVSFANTKATKVVQALFDARAPKFDYSTTPPTPIIYTEQQKLDWFVGELRSMVSEAAKLHHRDMRRVEQDVTLRTELEEYTL